jgi:hypothetical protein
VTLSALAEDDSGLSGVQFFLDGEVLGAEDTEAPYAVSWDTTKVLNGTHTLAARATDFTSNEATSADVVVTVNNQTGPLSLFNVQVANVTITSAQISWDTDFAATSQVILMDREYTPYKRVPEPSDSSMTNHHEVALNGLLPNTAYWFYVASRDGLGRLATTYNASNRAMFTTASISSSAPFDYRLDAYGPRNVRAGYDLYFRIMAVPLAGGTPGHWYFQGVNGLPPTIGFHLLCYPGEDPLNDGDDSTIRDGQKVCLNYNNYSTAKVDGRLRVAVETPPGAYSVTLSFHMFGVQRSVAYAFNVLSPPELPVKRPIVEVPPIPGIRQWEEAMVNLGKKWCKPGDIMPFGYEPYIWYYDGGRTYFQLADYTHDEPSWYPCALNIITQYRDKLITNNGWIAGNQVFPHGLAMNFWRLGDDESRRAAVLLSRGSPFALAGTAGTVAGYPIGDEGVRETAYLIDAYVVAEQLGESRNPRLAKAVDNALGHFDHLFVSETWGFNQPFYDGLLAEALIHYYELSGDPRIPSAIKTMLDWLWENAYGAEKHAFAYHPTRVPASYVNEQSHLIIPAFAWYWQLTGDPMYRERGDDVFAHALDVYPDWSGKVFNQNFRWSFDYVRWRSRKSMAYSTTHPQSNTPRNE